jgi:prephenate dehydrogenase
MFQGGLLALTIPPKTPEKVVNLTHVIASLLGADPFYIDPSEIDAITAITEYLPAIFGIALVQMAIKAPTWREIQRLASRPWALSSNLGAQYPAHELAQALRLNKANIVHRLDALIDELQSIRAMITEDEFETLTNILAESSNAYSSWLFDRLEGNLTTFEVKTPKIPRASLMERLLGSRTKKND